VIVARDEGPVDINGFKHLKRAAISTRTRGSMRRSMVPKASDSAEVEDRVRGFILGSMTQMGRGVQGTQVPFCLVPKF
jgi:hypothetical protein